MLVAPSDPCISPGLDTVAAQEKVKVALVMLVNARASFSDASMIGRAIFEVPPFPYDLGAAQITRRLPNEFFPFTA